MNTVFESPNYNTIECFNNDYCIIMENVEMSPIIKDNDKVVFKLNSEPLENDMVVYRFGNKISVRYYSYNAEKKETILTAENKSNKYFKEPIIFNEYESNELQILGVVRGYFREIFTQSEIKLFNSLTDETKFPIAI